MIQAEYIAQNPHMTVGSTPAIVDGVEMTVMVNTFEVQLVAKDLKDSSIVLRFVGDEIAGAQALFVNDAPITVQFDAPAPPPTP